jgi:CheY-like chemotaxis protein
MADAPGRRVLVVDDNRDSTETLSLLLKVKGYESRMAGDGEEALAVADEFRPDIVILDLGLPKMGGYEIAQQLRQKPYGATFTLVALTGWGGKDVRDKAAASGFDYHLLKPIQWEELERLLAAPRPACT